MDSQLSFRKTKTMGTLDSHVESVVLVQALGTRLRGSWNITPGKFAYEKSVYEKSCNLVHFGRKIVRIAIHNAFLDTLTVGTLFPCVPSAFQQWERRMATENARPDIARPSKLWGLTSRDWTTRHHIASVDIVRPDNSASD